MLARGSCLGPYEIGGLLGVGGMGEVYKAIDTRLGRTVAIKILPVHLAERSELRQRFEREAKTVSSLNHPHICTLFDVGRQDGVDFLVMEYVEGETLAEHLRNGALPPDKALRFALQIAAGLDAAHERGIVHRDLKPANIKITSAGVKLLDFGIAKVVAEAHPGSDLAQAQELTLATREGAILGTVGYMSPEQACGKSVDKRADIWAFGCVVYEALTGKPPFTGETQLDTLAAVLEREPDWSALPWVARGGIRDVLQRCLRKDPAKRLRDVADAGAEIEHALERWRRRSRVGVAAAAALASVLIAVGVALWWTPPLERTTVDPLEWVALTNFADSATQPALSADGRLLAFIRGPGTFTTSGQIYVKQLPEGEAVPLTNDELAKMSPVFSPDGTRIAYTVNGPGEPWNTWEVATLRGSPRRWLHNASGLTWIPDGRLLFSEVEPGAALHMGIVTSSETRTDSRAIYWPAQRDGMAHRSALSPDGDWVLVVEMDEQGVWLPCRLVPFAGQSPGTVVGPPAARCTYAAWDPNGRSMYFSADPGDGFELWRQRFPDGRPERLTSSPSTAEGLAIAPDGTSLITSMGQQRRAVWIRDGAGERQISGEGYAFQPLFSADGTRITYRLAPSVASGRTPTELWVTHVPSGTHERLLPGQLITQYDLAADDRVVAAVPDADGMDRLWLAWLDGREAPRPIPGAVGDNPRFGVGNAILFRAAEGDSSYLFRINENGGDRRRVSGEGVSGVVGTISPDGLWLSALASAGDASTTKLVSIAGAEPLPLFRGRSGSSVARLRWSPDRRRAYLSLQIGEASAFGNGTTFVFPLPEGSLLPQIPPTGFQSQAEIASIPGVETLPYGDVVLGPTPGTYAYSRETVARNLYRIPLR